MANHRTTADIVDSALERAGESTDGTSSYEATALKYVNSVYHAIIAGGNEFDVNCGEPWIWAQSTTPQYLKLLAPYTTGTCTFTNASTSATLSTAPSISLAGYFIKPDSGRDWYQVSSHTASTTAITLDQAYIEDTATSAVFTAIKTDYVLSTAVMRMCAPMTVYRDNLTAYGDPERGQIFELDINTMTRHYPRMLIRAGIPNKYCPVGYDTSGNLTVRFNSYPLDDIRVEVPYIPIATDLTDSGSSIPIIPFGFREVLVHGAAYYLMLDKSDNRAEIEAQLAKLKLNALVRHNRKSLSLAGGSYGRVEPRQGGLNRRWGRSEA